MITNAKIKDLKQQGKQNVEHKPGISTQDLQRLKYHPVLFPLTPLGLLRNFWFHRTLNWCRRGCEGQRNVTLSSFKFLKDENNHPFTTITHDQSMKNHPGDVESFKKAGRLCQTVLRLKAKSGMYSLLPVSKAKVVSFRQHLVRNPPARHTKVGHDDERDEWSSWPFKEVHKSFSEGNGNYPLVQCWPL